MSTLGYLNQVICEVTLHFGSKTTGVLKSRGTMNNRVDEATVQGEVSSTKIFFYQLTYGLAFHTRACGLEFCHDVLHHRAHIFHSR